MRWLFLRRLRPFVLLAGAASLVLNIALLVPALYMMQVFDRVFASRSLETLAMLTLAHGRLPDLTLNGNDGPCDGRGRPSLNFIGDLLP